jgi:hypothetical protein
LKNITIFAKIGIYPILVKIVQVSKRIIAKNGKRRKILMPCPDCGGTKFEPVGTFGYLFTGYISAIRCKGCGREISIEKKCNCDAENSERHQDSYGDATCH